MRILLDGLDWAFRFANATVDALLINDEYTIAERNLGPLAERLQHLAARPQTDNHVLVLSTRPSAAFARRPISEPTATN